ncbi:uncharacterized protein LOC143458735 [Clavelina lepadiformis]|uniref:uncharacterized protein LOC143458735 n=1 Tax=Clavelina lepadiformis TaxID=159417 RepID=UPI0040411557
MVLRNASGTVVYPTTEECDNNTVLPDTREWEISLKEGEFAYLQFDESSLNCLHGILIIKKSSGKQNSFICEPDKPGNYLFKEDFEISMERFTVNCSLAHISFSYFRFDFHLTMSNRHIQLGQSVQVTAKLTGADGWQEPLNCSLEYDGMFAQTLISMSTSIFAAKHFFRYPKSYLIYARCGIHEGSEAFETPKTYLYAECGLSHSSLRVFHKELSLVYLNQVEILFHHRYCFPISYSLLLNDVIIAQNQTQQVFSKTKFLSQVFEEVNFNINSSSQQLTGSGIHDVTLLLQNNISSVLYPTTVTFNEEIKDFKVTVKEYVGFHPYYFIINATVSHGAPINLTIEIKSVKSNFSHFNNSLFCPRHCHSMVVEATLFLPGMYKVEAIATNSVSLSSSSLAQFEALPQIYNVYISSLKPIPSYSRNYVYAFVRGDIGDYMMTIYLQGRPENHSFTISKLEYDHKDLPSLPFDAKSYKLIKVERVLYHIGMQQVTGFIRNSKQSFPFVGWVDVLETPSCLENLRIRDGNYQGGFEKALKVFDYFTFSVDFKCTCKNMSEVRYKWLVFPVATDMDMATYTYEVEFVKESFEPELIIRADTLSPGLYVIKVKVTSENVTSDVLEGKLKDYTLIEIPKKKLHFVILGGNVLQADNNMTVLRFESSIDYNKYHQHISYNWFCSIKQEELPTRIVMGKIQRKDSCFDWHTLWVTSDHVMDIFMNELRQSEHYYIRLIVSGPHYDATYADQKVVVQARQAPIVHLKCWSNCGKYFSPHLSIILQLECDDCLRRKWTLSPNPGHQLPLCDDQEFCKLNASLLIPSSNVTGTGYNIHGENSSVTIFLNALSSHSGGSCIILPSMGSAYTTKFNVTCAGYIEGKYQLMYKFFLQDKGLRYLLQYGFDPVLYNIILPPGRSSNDITIVIEICTPNQSCVEENLFITSTVVAKDDVNDDVINELDAALLSNNLQKIAQFVLVLSSTNKLNQSKRKEIISKMAEYPTLSLESVKQIADVISLVTNNPKLLEQTQLQDVQDILDQVESFVPFSASRYDDVNSIVRSCMSTTSQLMRLVRFYPFKNDENLRMNRLGKLLMASLTPGEEAISFETESVEGRMLKLNNHVTNPFDANTSFVQLSNLQSLITDDVINVEIFRYNSTSANFSPFDLKVDSVTSVSITTGWRDELPISKEIAKNLKLAFNLPQQPDKSKIWLRVKSECDGSACRSTAIGSAFVDVGGDFSGVREATILNIVVGNIEGQIRKLKIFLSPLSYQRSVSEREFDEKAPSYRWIVKSPSFGAVTCNITVQAYLGLGYYRVGTILSTVFSVYQLHCLHWLDAYNGWQENLCKPHEDTVSGRVMCKCGHFPITRIVWAQGRKRSSDDFKLGPSLLGSKLLVFPNKLDYNEISSNMWQRLLENPIVFSMLFVLYSLYGLGLIWARSKDRQVDAEDLYVEVPDNSPFDKYRYIVTMFTGSRRNSGTSAIVCLRLVGKMATSSAHVIQHHTKILNRGSVKSFLITTSECLGDITAIRLWHDNGGHSPEWFLQRVVVRDLEKNHCWFFLCNRWFKHVIDHVVPAARTKDLHNTRTLFPLRLENHLRDRYLWYAFYGMRPWQRHVMGRIEMLSCCLMITLMIMLTALMFHGNNHAQQGLLLVVGNYTFQWWHVAVGIESALLSSPATFLITTMFRRSQRPHKSLLTDSKSVDDEESNVNDEQNPVSHHPNVADGSKDENLKLELFHEQLPVDNKTHLRVKPNRETCVVEVAETSQHVMGEDRRVHHHQRKEATGKMNQKEKRKLKKESPKTEHHDKSKIHHRLKPYGKNRAFEVAGTSQQVLNEEHQVHHHRRKELNKELDQKERRKLNKESPKKQHRAESKIHHKERLKWVKELLLRKQHRGESKSHHGVKPHGENPAIEFAGTSQQVLSEKHRVHHHQRKESNDELDQKVRRKLKKESPEKDHCGESKILSKVKHNGEAPAIEVAETSRHVLSEERRVKHHQRKEASDEMDHKPRQKLVKEFPKKQHRGEKSNQGVKSHDENPPFKVTEISRHDLIEDRRVYHHQRKEANDKMDPKERRKLKKESPKKDHRGERKSHRGVKLHGESPANTVAHTSQRVLNEKHQVIHHQNKETTDELDQKERLKWVKELLLHKPHHDENKIQLGAKAHGKNPAIEVADTSRHLLSEDGRVHHHRLKKTTENMDPKERRKLKKESLKKQRRGESKNPGVKPHGETPANTVAHTSQRVLNEKHQVIHHQNKEMNDELDQKERLKWMIELLLHEDHHDENKSHQGVKPHGENPAIEVADTSQRLLSGKHQVHHHQRKELNDELDQKERRKLKKESPKKDHRGESKIFSKVKHNGEAPAIEVADTSRHVLSEERRVNHHQRKEATDELDQKERLKWMIELLLHEDHHDENKSHQGVKPHGENPAIEVADTSQRLLSGKHQVHHHQRKELNDELDQKERRKLKKESPKKDHRGESKIFSKVKHNGEAPAIEVADTSRHVLSEERRVNHHQRKEATDEMDHKPRQKLVKEFPKKQHRGESKRHQGVKPHGENPTFEVADTSRHDLIEDRRVYHHQRKETNDKMDKKERRKLKKEFLNKHHRGESHDFRRKSHQTGKRRHKHSIIVTKTARHVSSEGHSKHDAISQPQPSSGRVRFEEKSADDLKPPMRKIFLSSIVRDKDQPSTSSAAFVTSLSMPPRSPSIAMTSSQEPSTSSFVGMTSSQVPSTSPFVGITTSSQVPSTSSFVGMTSSQKPPTSSFVTEQVTPSARSHLAGQRVALSGTGAHQGIAFVENDPNSGDSRVLPHFFIYIAWILLVATVLTSTVLCVLYGMSYGIETCKEWLVSVSVAFLQSVIILEPLKEVLIAYVKVVNNPKLDLRDWIPPLPRSVTPRSHSGDCDAIKRKQDEERSRNRIYRPPSQLRIEITLQDIEKKIRTKRKIKNISLHLIFLVLLFIVTFGQTDRNSFQFGKTVQNMLLDGHRKMSSANDVYNWVEFSLADKFSIGRLTHFPDNQLLIVTPPTLRQKRVIKGTSCVHSDSAFKYGLSDTNQCKLHYENQFQEKRNHGPTWSRPPTHATKPSNDVYESCWEYSTANTSWLSSYIGDLALFYNPGGYYVTISKLANETRDQVHYLRRFGWIDGYTRFLMLETVLYNVPHRIYCVTMVAIEISNSGNYVVKPQLMFMRSHHVERAWDVAVQVALYGILVLVLYHLVEVASGFLEEGFRFLKNLWNVLLLFILMTSTLVVGLYLSRVTYTDQALQAYRNNMKSFHLYHMAAFTDYLTKCLLSICTFFTMLYTVKVMEGHPIFDLMHATIHRAKLEVLGLSLYIFFLYIAFCHVGLVLFGRSKDFSSVSKAMQSVVGFSMEAFTSTNLLRAYPIRGSIFLLLILFIFIKIFVNFFAAVLENTFRELKLLRRERLTRQHLMSFGRKHIRTVFTIRDEISERFKKLRSKRKVE